MGKKLADEYKIPFFETSAKSGSNISELFTFVANKIYELKLDLNERTDQNEESKSGHTKKAKLSAKKIEKKKDKCC